MSLPTLLVLSFAALTLGQRPFFAGIRPIGYPEVTTEALGDRFGEVDGTTQRLPVEAHGDRDLVDRLSKLPIDKQPFWFINWQALEAHRQKPQTYPQKPNPFIDTIQNNGGSNSGNFNSGSSNLNSGSSNLNSGSSNFNSGNSNLNSGSSNFNDNATPGNQNSNFGNGNVNTENFNANSGSSNAGFESSNRFGVEEHPNNQNPISNAFTNTNSGSSNFNSGNLSGDKKSPPKDNKVYHDHY